MDQNDSKMKKKLNDQNAEQNLVVILASNLFPDEYIYNFDSM